jgi:hypothetical protein
MKRVNICALASALAVFGGVGAAHAQSSDVGISLRAGVLFPTNSNSSSTYGSTWFAFGAEYRLFKLDPSSSLKPTVALSLDYFSRNHITETPILLNYVVHSNGFFGSVGAGAAFDHVPGSSETKFAYQVGIGYDIPNTEIPLFLEAKFFGNQDSSLDGVGVYAGVRF